MKYAKVLMKTTLVLCVLTTVSCTTLTDSDTVSTVSIDDYEPRSFTSDSGDTIPYRLFIPRDYDPNTQYPVVLFMHGGGGSGNDNERNLEGPLPFEWAGPERQAKNASFIVSPQMPGGGRSDESLSRQESMRTHIRTIHGILDSLEKEFSIDTDREYVTGLSMGGTCTWLSLSERPKRFAAAAPVCAGYKFIGLDAQVLGKQFAQTPLWLFHGDEDEVVSADYSREMVQALKANDGNPRYTEYAGVNHDSWDLAYREQGLIDWMFAQSK
jgi:predicted peptidase